MSAPPGPDFPPAVWLPTFAYRARPKDWRIRAFVLHSGDGTASADLSELTTNARRSAHFYVQRTGAVWQLAEVRHATFHAGVVLRREWSNAYTVGIETEHVDHRDDWPDSQVIAIGQLIAHLRAIWGIAPCLGHASICKPKGRKIDPHDFPWFDISRVVSLSRPSTPAQRLTSAAHQPQAQAEQPGSSRTPDADLSPAIVEPPTDFQRYARTLGMDL